MEKYLLERGDRDDEYSWFERAPPKYRFLDGRTPMEFMPDQFRWVGEDIILALRRAEEALQAVCDEIELAPRGNEYKPIPGE